MTDVDKQKDVVITQESIKSVVNSLLSFVGQEEDKMYESVSSLLPEVDFSEPDKFYMSITYPISKVMNSLLRSKFDTRVSDSYKLKFMYTNYDFIEHHFTSVIKLVETFVCCADKSRSVIRRLDTFFKTGKEITWDKKPESYWIPDKVFLTHEDILEFYNSLMNLYYGNSEPYIKFLHAKIIPLLDKKD